MSFWDASAILPLCIVESATSRVDEFARDSDLIAVWWGTVVEVRSALERKLRMGDLALSDKNKGEIVLSRICRVWSEVPPSETIRGGAQVLLAKHPLRAADALQLAAALSWAEDSPSGRAFVCLDNRLREAAAKEGFTLAP